MTDQREFGGSPPCFSIEGIENFAADSESTLHRRGKLAGLRQTLPIAGRPDERFS